MLIAISPWQKLQMKILCEHLKFSLISFLSFLSFLFLLFFFPAILQCFKLIVLFTFVQRSCHYKHPWFDDLLSRGKSVLFIRVWHFQAYFLHIIIVKAIKMMLNQPRGGHIFNIDGAGSDGRPTPRYHVSVFLSFN